VDQRGRPPQLRCDLVEGLAGLGCLELLGLVAAPHGEHDVVRVDEGGVSGVIGLVDVRVDLAADGAAGYLGRSAERRTRCCSCG
jgi:hypothetical protein